MTPQTIALLFGLFGVPALLMSLGHRLRGRSEVHKRRFWGGVFGYLIGMFIAIGAMFLPPEWWASEVSLRSILIHWAMVAGGGFGVLSGPIWARPPRGSR